MSDARTIQPDALNAFARALFEKAGASSGHAAAIADSITWNATRGIDSHGAARVAAYATMLGDGTANATPDISVSSTGAVSVLDADLAPGPVALSQAADLAVETARANGIGAVGVRRTVHTLAIGYYTSRIAEAGLVGIAFVAGMPNMAYTGVKGKAVATSPISISVPTADRPEVVLDMSTGVVALGKIRQAKAKGTPLPEGAAGDADGNPTTDPEKAVMPLPLGGPKGGGMSFAFELITSVLVGAPIVEQVHTDTGEKRRHRQNALIIAIDPAAFGTEGYAASVDATVAALKGLPVAEGVEEIYVPGDRSAATAAQRSRDGIPLAPKIWGDFEAKAAELGVPLPVT